MKKRLTSAEATIERLRSMPFAGMPSASDVVDTLGDRLGARDWLGVGLCVSALTLRVLAKAHGKGKG